MTVSKLLLSRPNLPKPLLAFVESGREDSCDLAPWLVWNKALLDAWLSDINNITIIVSQL